MCTPIAIYKMYVAVISICVRSVARLLLHVRFSRDGAYCEREEVREAIFVVIVLCSLRFLYLTICR
jgi:uncharacterized membrane protein